MPSSSPLLLYSLLTSHPDPRILPPGPPAFVSDGVQSHAPQSHLTTSWLSVGCVCSYGFSPSLIPQSGDCFTSGPWRFVRDASQRTGVSLLEEGGERSYFMGKETAAAKKDTELLGTAGGAGG